jgi:hypothetical protein
MHVVFCRGMDAASENPVGVADPQRSEGREDWGVLSLGYLSLHEQRSAL